MLAHWLTCLASGERLCCNSPNLSWAFTSNLWGLWQGKNILLLAQMLPRSRKFIFRCLSDSKSMLSAWNRPPWESAGLQLDPDTIFMYWINFKFAASQARRPDVFVSPDLPNSPIAAQTITLFFFPKETWSQFCGLARASAWFCHNSKRTQLQWMPTACCPARRMTCLTPWSQFPLSQCLPSWGFFCNHVIYAIKLF